VQESIFLLHFNETPNDNQQVLGGGSNLSLISFITTDPVNNNNFAKLPRTLQLIPNKMQNWDLLFSLSNLRGVDCAVLSH
jgi:hypothetical protein